METVSVATAIATLPEFGNLGELRRVFSIPRSTAYQLADEGEIRFVRLRKRGNIHGRVLVSFDSVREYLARCAAQDEGRKQ